MASCPQKKLAAILATNSTYMQNLVNSHTFKTTIRLILVIAASFILVNLLA